MAATTVDRVPRSETSQWTLTPAVESDHVAIAEFLQRVSQAPCDDEFTAQVERPGYLPSQRLLLRHEGRLVGHLLTVPRMLRFGSAVIPELHLADLATAPEYRGAGCAAALLQSAWRRAMDSGAVWLSLRTANSPALMQQGWLPGPRHCYSAAAPREVLARIARQVKKTSPARKAAPITVRRWRHFEQDALVRLQSRAEPDAYGRVSRSESDWRWLVSRNACDDVYVAVEGQEPADWTKPNRQIMAYAFVRDERIVELTAPGHPRAGLAILKRVCGDLIETGCDDVRLEAPPNEPLHQLLDKAGGKVWHVDLRNGLAQLIRITCWRRLLHCLHDELQRRADQQEIARPAELGIAADEAAGSSKASIALARQSLQVVEGRLGRSYISGKATDLCQCFCGRLSISELISRGLVAASTQSAARLAASLFPQTPLWLAPLDDMPARQQ